MKKKTHRRGFTIVELVIVIAVIAILATTLMPTFGNVISNAQEAAAKQEAKNAYTSYMVANAGHAELRDYYFYKGQADKIVVLHNGAAVDVYDSEEELLKELFDDPKTPAINEGDCFKLRELSSSRLYVPQRTKLFLTEDDFAPAQGAVDSATGQIVTEHTYNWYAEIPIPEGATQVRFLNFKTGQRFGSAFMDGTTWISGHCDKNTGGQWVTLDIPENATVLRYGYLIDAIAAQNGYPLFEYLEFIGEYMQYGDDTPETETEQAVRSKAMAAYAAHLASDTNASNYCFLYEVDGKFVVIAKGDVADVYDTKQAAVNAMNALVDDPNTQEIDGTFELRATAVENLSKLYCTQWKVYIPAEIRTQGVVDSTNGKITVAGMTDMWYSNVAIPAGAKQVETLTFKTGQSFGYAFMNDAGWLSGACDKTNGGQKKTERIPENATVFRYGYLTDSAEDRKNAPHFEYLTFKGDDIQYVVQPPVRHSVVKECFSVNVNIAPALGQDGVVNGTDYGYIILPKNYTEDGEPTRLIIVCHGAGASLGDYGSTAINESMSQYYWVSMGYAIMDMYACPPQLAGGKELHYGNPTVLECYEKGYEYVMQNYNLKTDGIFVLGSSMGGLSSFQIVQSGKFPVLAQVANCPVIDLFKQAYCNPWYNEIPTYQREKIASYFDFEGEKPAFTTQKHVPSQAEIEYFKNNFDKVTDYSPIFANVTSGDVNTIFNKIPTSATAADAEEAALYAQLTANHPCPLLIIHNKNDVTVSYRYSQYLYDMIKRGNPTLDVRLKLYDTGNHTAWNNGEEATIEDYYGNPIVLKESKRLAIDFLKQYEP